MKAIKTLFFTLALLIPLQVKQAKASSSDMFKVLLVKGDIRLKRAKNERKIFQSDILIANDRLITGPKSVVVLAFGEGFASRMKITQNSDVLLKGTSADKENNNIDTQNFFIFLGNMVVKYINKNRRKRGLKVRSKMASLAVRGTEFFVHVSKDGQTLMAVKSGVVLVKHSKSTTGIPLVAEEGVLFGKDGGSGKLTPPAWYKSINWNLKEATEDIEKLMHSKELESKIKDKITEKIITINAQSLEKASLPKDVDQWKKECLAKNAESCNKLAFYLLKSTEISKSRPLIEGILEKGCSLKNQKSCVWQGRVQYEFGDKKKGRSLVIKQCEKKNAYACYSLWEMYKAEGADQLAEVEYKKALSIIHNLPDLDLALNEFSKGCEVKEVGACYNYSLLLENLNRKNEARVYYQKACDQGDGEGCSDLGFNLQNEGKIEEAKKLYQKACFLNVPAGCYNLACIYSKKKKLEHSIEYLRMAILGGFQEWDHMNKDQDLTFTRSQPIYSNMIKEVKEIILKEKKPKVLAQ
jgi:TPR repeat protein